MYHGLTPLLNLSSQGGRDDDSIKFHSEINASYKKEWNKYLTDFKFKHGKSIPSILNLSATFDIISKICLKMGFSPDIEFSAFDSMECILERFLHDLTNAINEEAPEYGANEQCWTQVYEIFEQDAPLIILLAIGLATKYIDSKNCFGATKISELIEQCTGVKYQLSEIIEHEYNLFKTMDFVVTRPAALHSMEHLMKIIHDPKTMKIRINEFLMLGTAILRFAYLEKNRIYGELESIIQNPNIYKQFTDDKVLLSAAVVYSACKIICLPRNHMNQITSTLSDECLHEENDILVLGHSIFKSVVT